MLDVNYQMSVLNSELNRRIVEQCYRSSNNTSYQQRNFEKNVKTKKHMKLKESFEEVLSKVGNSFLVIFVLVCLTSIPVCAQTTTPEDDIDGTLIAGVL